MTLNELVAICKTYEQMGCETAEALDMILRGDLEEGFDSWKLEEINEFLVAAEGYCSDDSAQTLQKEIQLLIESSDTKLGIVKLIIDHGSVIQFFIDTHVLCADGNLGRFAIHDLGIKVGDEVEYTTHDGLLLATIMKRED